MDLLTLGFPERDRILKRDVLAPIGLLAACELPAAAACLALDQIDARDWASYGGWGHHADGSMRRGWVQHRQRKASVFALQLMTVFGSGTSSNVDIQRRGEGWLNLVVLPDANGRGSMIEVRADLDAEMHAAVRSVVRGLFVTIIRVWDPTVP